MLVLRADSPAGPFQQVGMATNTTIFRDKSADPNAQSYCYQIVFQNNCGNVSPPSRPACSIWLGSKSTGIDWTADSPFAPGTVSRYVLEIYDTQTNTLYREIPLGGNTHYEPDPNDVSTQTFRYRIRAESSAGESTSNYFELKRNAGIFAPTTFTPNGDGQNDRFVVFGTFLEQFEMIIYSRWGDPIFSSTSINENESWDGNVGGQPAPVGPYSYRINVRDKDGQQIVKRGTVMLLR
jgi:gliding motility-associated-like protein